MTASKYDRAAVMKCFPAFASIFSFYHMIPKDQGSKVEDGKNNKKHLNKSNHKLGTSGIPHGGQNDARRLQMQAAESQALQHCYHCYTQWKSIMSDYSTIFDEAPLTGLGSKHKRRRRENSASSGSSRPSYRNHSRPSSSSSHSSNDGVLKDDDEDDDDDDDDECDDENDEDGMLATIKSLNLTGEIVHKHHEDGHDDHDDISHNKHHPRTNTYSPNSLQYRVNSAHRNEVYELVNEVLNEWSNRLRKYAVNGDKSDDTEETEEWAEMPSGLGLGTTWNLLW